MDNPKTEKEKEPIHEAAPIGDKKATSEPLPATTTEQEDIVTAGQRRVNIIWEKTQRHIALGVVGGTLLMNMSITVIIISGYEVKNTQLALIGIANLNSLANLIVGFYFARTNHSTIGGVGRKHQDQSR